MSSEAITRNDLTAILNGVLPSVAVDYIVEQGTSGIWTYRKWASGVAECWGTTASVTYAMTNTVGGNGYTTDYWSLPSGLFTSVGIIDVHRVDGGNGLVSFSVHSSSTSRFDYYVWITGTTATVSMKVGLNVKGRWK